MPWEFPGFSHSSDEVPDSFGNEYRKDMVSRSTDTATVRHSR